MVLHSFCLVCLVFAWFLHSCCLVTLNPKPMRSLINDSASITSHQSLLTCCLNICFCLMFACFLQSFSLVTINPKNMLPKYVFLPSVCSFFAQFLFGYPKPLRSLINDSASVTSHQSLLTCCLNMCFCLVFAWFLLDSAWLP